MDVSPIFLPARSFSLSHFDCETIYLFGDVVSTTSESGRLYRGDGVRIIKVAYDPGFVNMLMGLEGFSTNKEYECLFGCHSRAIWTTWDGKVTKMVTTYNRQ
ncbi:unnamed protein product [Dovyalis caffra]|uniref:Uncharacterized protein n=1 Tax=Dovyalis caffra TaxID=77055 RepID=A0AAV1QU22_9ROSI|nr:unnamed protein product [Dovyalis caffra]